MADKPTVDQIADDMVEILKATAGKKKLKAGDLTKEMIKKYGDVVDKKMCKEAIRKNMDAGRTVYEYFGGSFIGLPREEGAAKGDD